MNLATLLAVCLVLGAVSRPVWAQEGLPPQAAAELVRAAAEKEPHHMRVVVVSVIARHPSLRAVIVREAVRLRPEWAPDIATAAVRAFPFFVQDIAAAATTGQPGERRRAIGEAIAAARPEMHIRIPVEAKVPEAPQPEPAPPPSRWSGHVELGGSRSTGNTDRTQFSGAVRVKYEKARWEHKANLSFDFARDDGQTTAQRLVANLEPRYRLTPRTFAFGFGEYEDDRFGGFSYRLTEVVGLGYRLVDEEAVKLIVEAGPGSRQSKVKSTGDTEVEVVGQFKGDFAWKLSDSATLSDNLVAVAGSERHTIDNTTALTMKIVDRLSGKLSFNVRHNTDVPAGTESTDTLTKGSLVYDF
jgi:putative salt-induced outer membrane protein